MQKMQQTNFPPVDSKVWPPAAEQKRLRRFGIAGVGSRGHTSVTFLFWSSAVLFMFAMGKLCC